MRYLITGSSGFVGRQLCRRLLAEGAQVTVATRTQSALEQGVGSVCVGEIDEGTEWSTALQGVDVVIHLAARVHVMNESASDPLAEFRRVNVAGTERLAKQAAQAGVTRLVYVSSIKVNGEETQGGSVYTEGDIPAPQDPYGISKLEAERSLRQIAQETGVDVVVLRPPLVYGPGVGGNFIQMMHVLARGIPLPLASVRNKRSLIYVGNLADALVRCAAHPAAAGKTYLVSDGEDISTPELLRSLAEAMGCKARLLPFPPGLLRVLARLAGRGAQADRLLGSLRVESGKIRQELDWNPPVTLQQGLQATAEWYRTENL